LQAVFGTSLAGMNRPVKAMDRGCRIGLEKQINADRQCGCHRNEKGEQAMERRVRECRSFGAIGIDDWLAVGFDGITKRLMIVFEIALSQFK